MTPIVAIEDVHYAYPPLSAGGASPAVLSGVSLSLAEGECLALLGRTGAGKSTLCLTLNGIVPQLTGGAFHGQVRVAGRDAQKSEPGELSRTVGLVFQDPESQFFSMTVEDEVAFGPESLALPPHEIEQRIAEALVMTGIAALRHRSPLELSGGEKQRVALAAVLATRPRVLVLDEPTASLDPLGKQSLLEAVDRLRTKRKTTILWVTQDVDQLPLLADRVAVLDDGRIVLEGGLREVLAQADRLRDLGVRVPQMAELAERFNGAGQEGYGWLTVDEAAGELRSLNAGSAERGVLRNQSLGRRWRSARLDDRGWVQKPFCGGSSSESPGGDQSTRESEPGHRDLPPQDRVEEPPNSQPAVELKGCSYRYDDQALALHDMSCRIREGSWLALIGQNGSGKSTLAKLCNGLLRPDEGRVLIMGDDIRGRPVGDVARQVGYLFQNPDHQIFASTVRQEVAFGLRNLGFPDGEVEQRVEEALTLFDLIDQADRPPAVLGHGLRRQVTLASLFARCPPILILDEPTSGLDGEKTRVLLDHLDRRCDAGGTIIFITHDLRLVAERATHVLLLHRGELLAQGRTREILSQPELLAQASVAPPPITRLSQALRAQGMRGESLTVDAFHREFVDLLSERGGR